ncbi:Mismatch repair protein msh3 [Thecaphora frezii]
MAPPPAGQATISSFFKPKSTATRPTNTASASSAPPPQPSYSSLPPSSITIRSSSRDASQRPSKVARTTTADAPSTASQSRMQQWRFLDSQTSSSHQPTATSQPSQPSAPQQTTHQAFRDKLLSKSYPLSPTRVPDELNASTADTSDDANSDDPVSEEKPSNRFDSFAADVEAGTSATQCAAAQKAGPSRRSATATRKTGPADNGPKYTPLEKQILELKHQHPGILLIIEVGYKLKFYGEDARIASKELNIMCFPERNLLTAMIPVHRLHIHVKKLIAAGHKVGVVRQIETRALKAASNNASAPFTRKLTALYTASTWIDDLSSDSFSPEALDMGVARPKTLMAITERIEGGNGPDERISCGIIAVEVSTGSIVYDQFSDGNARSELETRLAHLFPAELLLPPKLSKSTEKMLNYLAGQGSAEKIRVERMDDFLDYNQAFQHVTRFYNEQEEGSSAVEQDGPSAYEAPPDQGELLTLAISLPHLALIALASIIKHLEAFGLQSICRLSTNFQSFSNRTTMTLNGNTLTNLEIFRNSTDGIREKGSLIWILDRCKTMMGRRLLRKWVSRPLTDRAVLTKRIDAVQAIAEGKSAILRGLPSLLQGLPDLEKGLARMTYGRSTPTELATILLSMNRITQEYKLVDNPADLATGSDLLNEAVADLPRGKTPVQEYLRQISIKDARANNKAELFLNPDQCPKLQEAKDNIAIVENDLREHLQELRKYLKRPSLEYAMVSGIDYLVEVRTNDAKKVPANWLRISATKQMVRFHTPTIIDLLKKRDQYRETMNAEAEAAFQHLIKTICSDHYVELRNVVTSLATLDALVSLAAVAALPGYCRPELDDGTEDGNRIEIKGMRHPIVEVLREDIYVPNDITLGPGDGSTKAILLTGSNMGGKSSVVRALALNVIMAQIGSYIPATSARISIHDSVFTRMGASDDLAKGRSTFMLELLETCTILRSATPRSLVILDELGRGTSTTDGLAIAHAVLEHFLQLATKAPNLVFVTHYFQLGSRDRPGLRNMHMSFIEEETAEGHKGIRFLYTLKAGMASRSFGVHCARLAGLPIDLLETAQMISEQRERDEEENLRKRRSRSFGALLRLWTKEVGAEDLDLIEEMKQTWLE